MTHSAFFPGGTESFTCVGNVAPPMPTMPASLILAMISCAEKEQTFTSASERSMPSAQSSPSRLMVIIIWRRPWPLTTISTAVTVPEIGEWMFADMKLPASAMSWPVSTRSPLATLATAGAPMCCARGIVTTSGSGSTSIGLAQLNLFSDGWTPPIGNVLIDIVRFYFYASASKNLFRFSLSAGRDRGATPRLYI